MHRDDCAKRLINDLRKKLYGEEIPKNDLIKFKINDEPYHFEIRIKNNKVVSVIKR